MAASQSPIHRKSAQPSMAAKDVGTALEPVARGGIEIVQPAITATEDVRRAVRAHRETFGCLVGGETGTLNAGGGIWRPSLPWGYCRLARRTIWRGCRRSPADPLPPRRSSSTAIGGASIWVRANDRLFFNVATIGLSAGWPRRWTLRPSAGSVPLAYEITLQPHRRGRPSQGDTAFRS